MKMITATGALEAGIVKLGTVFPIETSATISGFDLQNANGEACGGTLLHAFAVSCNSVFAPLGARLGGRRLVNIAERFGFNQQPSIPGAAEPTIPSAASIGDDLAVGSSAIGQGAVQASALEMMDVGATIAMGGRRPLPTLQWVSRRGSCRHQPAGGGRGPADDGRGRGVRDRHRGGDPGVTVAGKTGTAELTDTARPRQPKAPPRTPTPGSSATPRSARPRSSSARCSRTRAPADSGRAGGPPGHRGGPRSAK